MKHPDTIPTPEGIHPLVFREFLRGAFDVVNLGKDPRELAVGDRQKLVLAAFRRDPEEYVKNLKSGRLNPREEAVAWRMVFRSGGPRGKLYAIEAVAECLRAEMQYMMDEFPGGGRRVGGVGSEI